MSTSYRRWRRARLHATLGALPAVIGYAATITMDDHIGNIAGIIGLTLSFALVTWAAYTAGEAAAAMRACEPCRTREERY